VRIEAEAADKDERESSYMAQMAQVQGMLAESQAQVKDTSDQLKFAHEKLEESKQLRDSLQKEGEAASARLQMELQQARRTAKEELARQAAIGKELAAKMDAEHKEALAGIRTAAEVAAASASVQYASLQESKLELQRRFDNRYDLSRFLVSHHNTHRVKVQPPRCPTHFAQRASTIAHANLLCIAFQLKSLKFPSLVLQLADYFPE
jgi:hypothetical protein